MNLSFTRKSSRLVQLLAASLACAMMVLVLAPVSSEAKKPEQGKNSDSARLRRAVSADSINLHLKELQDIAVENDGNRASGFPGFDASADYVVGELEGAGYDVTRQEFDFDTFIVNAPAQLDQTAPTPTTYTENEDFAYMEFSGSGDVTAGVTNVDLVLPPGPDPSTSNSGCEESDFAGFPAGDIALMQRGTCDFGLKAVNAANAGAVGAIIFNEGQPGRTDVIAGTLGSFRPGIPTFGMSFELGNELAGIPDLELHMFADTTIETRTTENILAETPGGDPDNVVMAGGHLDSVQEGPGINDNGSGTMSLLDIALKMKQLKIKPENKIRFAFWGAEESGLIGSTLYVDDLVANDPEEFSKIAMYLNFDMVGSPNFVRFVYDGDGSAFPDVGGGPAGSDKIEAAFTDFWANRGLESEETAFDGRSDYLAFILNGVPSGGLFSGAEVLKTEEQEAIYGGVAGLAYDPCYHQACDTFFNTSDTALNQFSDVMAHVITKYGENTRGIGQEEAEALRTKAGRNTAFHGSHATR
ncbi:MAG: M28 family metallopeptidase [Actinomycetota bacterium]